MHDIAWYFRIIELQPDILKRRVTLESTQRWFTALCHPDYFPPEMSGEHWHWMRMNESQWLWMITNDLCSLDASSVDPRQAHVLGQAVESAHECLKSVGKWSQLIEFVPLRYIWHVAMLTWKTGDLSIWFRLHNWHSPWPSGRPFPDTLVPFLRIRSLSNVDKTLKQIYNLIISCWIRCIVFTLALLCFRHMRRASMICSSLRVSRAKLKCNLSTKLRQVLFYRLKMFDDVRPSWYAMISYLPHSYLKLIETALWVW